MKNSILEKARWLREVALATSKNNGARVAREWLKYAAMFVMLFTIGSGNAWGAEDTSEFTSKAFEGLSNSWSKNSSGTLGYDATRGVQHLKNATTTFTAEGFSNVTKVQVWVAKSSSGKGSVTIQENSTAKKTISIFKTTLTEESYSWATPYTGTLKIVVKATASSIYIKKIVVTTSGGGDCSECTYYVYNGSTWVDIGTTGFDDVVLAPPTLPGNGHGAGNGCWVKDKTFFDGGCTSNINNNNNDYRFVPNPDGEAPDAENKPGNGTCELYAVYWDGGCLSTTVTAVQCARIWEEPDNLAVSSVSSTGATLSWDAIDGVSSYHVIVTKVSNSSIVFDGNVNGTSKSLTGLTSGTEYSWKVAANSATNDACDSNFSNVDNFTTCASGFTSLTPTVTADKTGKNGGEALFELSGATSYSVTLKNNSTNAVIAGYNNVSNTSGNITFSGLTASTTYRVEVIAHNACGDNSKTGSETFTTDAATLYTVTFVNQSGAAVSPATQPTEGGSVTLPSASPSVACAALGWTFAGWKDGSAEAETTATPTLIAAGSYTPSENKTFYAVFTKTEGGGGGVKTTLLSSTCADAENFTDEDWPTKDTYYLNDPAGALRLGKSKGTGSITSKSLSAAVGTTIKVDFEARAYNLNDKGNINVTVSGCDQQSVLWATYGGSTSEYTSCSLSFVTTTPSFTVTIATSQKRAVLKNIEIYYGGGGGGTTYWNSNPSCSTAKLDHITITTPPTTTNYLVGQVFSSAGAVVTAYYDDDSHHEVTASWTPTTPLTAGTGQTATASYTEGGVTKTATTTINVYAVTLQKKDENNADIASTPPTVSCSVAALSASETGNSYKFKEWQISGASLDDASSLTPNIINVTGEVTVTAVYWKPITVTWYVSGSGSSNIYHTDTHAHGWSLMYPTNPDPEDYSCDGKVFVGWTRLFPYTNASIAPALVASGTEITSDENLYAVFATETNAGTPPTWTKTALGSVTAGTYLMCTADGHVFNGEINASNRGQITASAFSSFTTNTTFNVAAPSGSCEMTFTQVATGHFTMYAAGKGYLYCSESTASHIKWHETETDYWFNKTSHWRYSGAKDGSGNETAIVSYSNSDFRNYVSPGANTAAVVLLKKTAAGSPATYSNYTTSCACEGFSFHTGSGTDEAVKTTNTRSCFEQVESGTTWQIENYTIPSDAKFFVGWQDEFKSSGLGTSSRSSVQTWAAEMYFEYSKNYGDGWRKTVGAATGAVGTLRIWSDNNWNNCHVGFAPNGYVLKLGSTSLEMHDATSGLDGAQYKETDVVTLTGSDISGNFQVNLYTGSAGGVACDNSVSKAMTTMGVKSGSGDNWRGASVNASTDANTKGFFRIDLAQTHTDTKNWNAHWVPCYELTFDLKGGSGSIAATPAYVSCEGDAAARTVAIPNTAPTKAGYRFIGWSDTDDNTVEYAAGSTHNVTLSGNKTVYAVWKQVYTVTYDYAGGTGTCSNGEYIEGEAVTVCASTPTKAGSDFNGWSYTPSVTVSAGKFTMPASNVVITATWTDHTYVLNHSGSNYTNTENQTTIKSGDTPLTLHYTCAGTYGFPNSISISGGGKSWTVGTDYTWTVAADKKSATLVIKATTITADVTITITMSTFYTVTYVHHDKGIFSGASTTESVRSDDNVITLPTVTSVSCGFYDTFEGWIASGSEYSESTSKPATVYAGGSSYTVTGDVTLRALYSKCEGDGGEVYAKVTTDPGDWSGTYLIINENYGKAMNGSETQANLVTTSNNVAVTISNSQVVSNSTTDTYAFTIAPHSTASGRYSIRSYSGYYIGSNSARNAINATPTETTYSNAISISDGVLTIGCGQYKNGVEYRLMFMGSGSGSPIFKYYPKTQGQVCLYKKQSLCTKSYATNPSCVKPVGVHIVYNANAGDATMNCNNHNRTYKVQDEVNQYPKLASAYSFCTDATRDGYTLVGWNTQTNGLGTTYELGTNYSNLPVSGELDGENWVTLTVYAMWAPSVKFNLGNAAGGTGVPDVVEADGGFMLPTPTAAQLGTIPCDYTFYAWSESSVVSTTTKPAIFMPGTKYTGAARTLYAVYRKSEGGVNPDLFSLSYMYNSTKYYVAAPTGITTAPSTWNNDKAAKFSASTNAEDAVAFGMKTNADYPEFKEIYWVYDGVEEEKAYLSYSSGANITFKNEEDTYYHKWTITGTTTLTFLHSGGRYLSGDGSEIGCPSSVGVSSFTKEEASATTYTYATRPTCETTATLAFVTNGGKMNYPDTYDENNYVDLKVGTNVYLPTATYPGEWVFEGWMKGAPVTNTDVKPESANFYTVTLGETTYSAAPVGTTTFYAVYSKTVNDKQFDPNNEGTYKLFAIMADGTKKYMPTWDGTRKTLSPVTNCAATGDYTITPGTGEHAGQYKITHGNYTLGVVGEDDTQFKDVADTWWDIENSTSNKGTWRIKVHGSSERCLALSGTGFFSNTLIRGFVNNPSQPGYRDMEIGECIYTEYTSTPENIPYITITGSPVKITSTKDERVYAPTKVHIEAHNFTGVRTIHLSATNGFATNPASVKTAANGAYSGDVDVYYQPTTVGDGSIVSSVLTAEQTAGTTEEQISQTFSALQGRNMPAKFVIAAKIGGQWYAMPDDKSTTETMTALPIEVNDADAPTSATLVPHNVEWSLSDVVNSNDRPKDKVYLYESNKMKDDGITPWNYALYAGTAPTIGTYGQVSGISGTSSDRYEWGLTTSDLLEYTISNATVGKNISISNAGNFGTHASAIASSTLFLLPIENYYELAEMQAVEWKANSVVVMFRGAGSKATAKLGAGAEGSAQSLTSVKKDHGVYEIATGDLTSAAGQSLAITIKNSSDVVLGRKLLVVPAIVSVNKNSDALGVTTDAAAATDVVVLDGATLSAAATKYTFKNITVYPGGKLVIGSGKQLGMASLTLRGGSAWGAATYEHKYPQFVVNNATSGAYSNSSAVINYDYVTTKDQYYSFVLPYASNTKNIKYPLDIYGSAVSASNTGSFEFQYYDGAARAAGGTGWKVLEEDPSTGADLVVGTGYTFLGMPKKVDAYDGTDDSHANLRQRYGIHRIPMGVAANAVQAGETGGGEPANKPISINVTLASKNNNSGWALVGNPYLSNVSGLSNTDIQVGKLVHTDTNPWDGKWQWDNPTTGVRYIVTTDDGQNFESQQASTATLKAFKNFFVQIKNGEATSLVIPANTRTDKDLAPARYMADVEQDIQLAVDLVSETRSDKVDLLINDVYTAEFDQDGDFTKMMNTTNFNLYGVYPGDNLSFIAVDKTTAAGSIAIGYQVPAAGEYTLQLSERPYVMSDYVETLLVTDHEVSPEVTTDLLENPYSFTVTKAETNDARFTVSIKLKENQDTPTDIDIINGGGDLDGEKPIKFIYHDKMYILRNGVLYDATGKTVREIK